MSDAQTSETARSIFAGIDVGGTNIKIGLVDDCGNVLSESTFATEQRRGPADAIQRMTQQLNQLLSNGFRANAQSKLVAVGLGTPGTMDVKRGWILEPPNLPGWRHFPIRDELSRAVSKPVAFANDANAAAFGEFWLGRAQAYDSMVLFTLGTGVGSGIVIDGRLIQGATGNAAECGHLCVDFGPDARICSCGLPGHLEAYASASAVAARANEIATRSPSERLGRKLADAGSLSARDVFELAVDDDAAAWEIIMETAEYLSRGIAAVAHTVDPEIAVLGGAMDFGGKHSSVGCKFLRRIKQRVADQTFTQVSQNLKIEFASLGSAAGWIGAAGLAKRLYDHSQP